LGHFLWHSKFRGSLDNGELLLVATHSETEQTEQLVQVLREHWPGVYVIREIADRDHEPLNDKPSHRLREFSYTRDKRIDGD
jgi:hypothetical protein